MRPLRTDFPSDDGIDEDQHRSAIIFFAACGDLQTISFNGIPKTWAQEGQVPGRVWAKGEGIEGGGVRLVGRAEIPWKLSEFWRG
jgi:hypothetical protein